jgi:hypothetical protein
MARKFAVFLTAILLATTLSAATRMTYDIKGQPTPIEWAPTSFPLPYEIDQRLHAANPGVTQMIDRAFGAWASAPNTNVRFESRGIVPGVGASRTTSSATKARWR